MTDYNGPDRRRDSTTERVVRLETLVETVTEDIRQVSRVLHEHIEKDAMKFEQIQSIQIEDRSEIKSLIAHVASIADDVKKNGRFVTLVIGGSFAVATLVGTVFAVLKFILPLLGHGGT